MTKKISQFIESLRLFKNKLRMWFLKRFTDRIKVIKLVDKKGKEYDAVHETQVESVCPCNKLKQVHHIFWQCVTQKDCDKYWILPQKIIITEDEMIKMTEDLANHLYVEFSDDETNNKIDKTAARS